MIGALRWHVLEGAPEVLDLLVEESRRPEVGRRCTAAHLLGHVRELAARDALLVLVDDADAEVRQVAAGALALRREVVLQGATDVAIEEVVRHLDSEHPETRAWALSALGGYGDEGRAHTDTLVRHLEDPDERIRASAAWALVQLGVENEKAEALVKKLMERSRER